MAKREASFRGWLQRVRRTGEFSDVMVTVAGQDFCLHILPLLNASSFFRAALLPSPLPKGEADGKANEESDGEDNEKDDGENGGENDGEDDGKDDGKEGGGEGGGGEQRTRRSSSRTRTKRRVEVPDLAGGVAAFSAAMDFCYLIKPSYSLHSIAAIRAVADQLGMAELLDNTKRYLYSHVFSHWRSSMAYLEQRPPPTLDYPPVVEYIELRCLKVITAACAKAFYDTKYLSAPIPLSSASSCSSSSAAAAAWQFSPCRVLMEILTKMAALPDRYVIRIVDELVDGGVNLSLKCRQGRNVKAWLDGILSVGDGESGRSRAWIVVCLTRMLEKSVSAGHGHRPWLELSSQYWCTLLEHASSLVARLSSDAVAAEDPPLPAALAFLECRVGGSLHELDDYLHSYKFEPPTLVALVRHFGHLAMPEGLIGGAEIEEVAAEVDSCLCRITGSCRVSDRDFVSVVETFPPASRKSHDLLYTAIEKRMAASFTTPSPSGLDEDKVKEEEHPRQELWHLVDLAKLSPAFHERAVNNPTFLCQPHVLEAVLRHHGEELSKIGDEDRQHLRRVMQKVIRASLKLLEENSRRYTEIVELQKKYAALSSSGNACPHHFNAPMNTLLLVDSCENSPNMLKSRIAIAPPTFQSKDLAVAQEEIKVHSDTLADR